LYKIGKNDFLRKAEAAILYEFNIDPRTLNNDEFVRFYQDYVWIKDEENRAKGGK